MNKLIYFLVVLFAINKAQGQQLTFKGYLKDSITHFPIAGGVVSNINTKQKVTTAENGYFSIQSTPQNFIYILANTYRYDTLTFSYLFTDTITIYLAPTGNILPTITVKSQYSKYQVDSITRRQDFEEGRGTQLNTFSTPNNSGFGIALNLNRIFKSRYKNKKSNEQSFDVVERNFYIDYRFSPHLVSYYTGFKGETLQLFMQKFTPTYEWLKSHTTNEDVLYYINEKLKEFKQRSQ